MTVETVNTENGTLTFHREGRKLVKVVYKDNNYFTEAEIADLGYCDHCGTFVEVDHEDAVFYDLTDNFLCNYSPSGMHEVIEMIRKIL